MLSVLIMFLALLIVIPVALFKLAARAIGFTFQDTCFWDCTNESEGDKTQLPLS